MSDTMQTARPHRNSIELLRDSSWRALLRWGGFLVAVAILFGVVVSVGDLRDVDPIFIPATILLVLGCLVVGFTTGRLLTIRRLRRH